MAQTRLGEADRLFTIGYEGRLLDGFLELLTDEGVEQLVDVRENPWSRKPGFTKGELAEAVEAAGLAYEHLGALGTPKPIREKLRQGELDFEPAYRAHLDEHPDAVERLEALASQRPTAIMCMEADPRECHRRLLAQRFEEAGWSIIHLGT